jgi:hypothetical protein
MLCVVGFGRVFSMASGVERVSSRYVRMMRRLLVLSALVVFRCFAVVTRWVICSWAFLWCSAAFFDIGVFSVTFLDLQNDLCLYLFQLQTGLRDPWCSPAML